MNLLSHDVQIGQYHSANDFFLIPASKLVVTPPVERVEKVEVPGSSAPVYLARKATGYPVYEAREGSWEFYIDTDAFRAAENSAANPVSGYTGPVVLRLKDYIGHMLAKQCQSPSATKIILEDDPAFYYTGLVWLGDSSGATAQHSKITLNYLLYPFKFLAHPLNQDWEWDSFNFETDLAPQPFHNIQVPKGETVLVEIPPSDRPAHLKVSLITGDTVDVCLVYWDDRENKLIEGGLIALRATWTVDLATLSRKNFDQSYAVRLRNGSTTGDCRVFISYNPAYL